MFAQDSNGSMIIKPRAAGAFLGSLVLALALGVLNAIGLLRLDASDRYPATTAETDRMLIEARIAENSRVMARHYALKWHGEVGVELREYRTRIEALERAVHGSATDGFDG